MIEIIPNWHPIWVHFAIALLAAGALIYLVMGWKGSSDGMNPATALTVARWMLWLGAGAALVALLTGYWASTSVVHDELAHANMMVHRNWAFATAAFFLTAIVLDRFRKRRARASILSAVFLLAGVPTLVMTGLEGAENVYEYGLGVQRLPEPSTHQHSHEGPAKAPNPAVKEAGDGHSHSHAAASSPSQPGVPVTAPEHPAGQVASALSQAIISGDIEQLKSLMIPDVLIFESGNVESSLAEYESHHMQADMAFMSGMNIEVMSRHVIAAEEIATVVTQSRVQGTYKEKDIDLINTETLVLRNLDGQWKIVHIHWSSS